jgi:hypothetical protein
VRRTAWSCSTRCGGIVFQWFPSPRDDEGMAYGMDPRRHSVGLCFALPIAGEPAVVEGGEALDFAWFELANIDQLNGQAWPGTVSAIRGALADSVH